MSSTSVEECPLQRQPTGQRAKNPKTALKGPLRVLRLCILSIILPTFLIAGPLYLRYHVYADQLYPLAMSDMRLIDNRISTTWCQRQLVQVNTTFNAFLLPESPKIAEKEIPLSMVRHLMLEDDMKEYWGFYLLSGSTVTVATCVRWPGASLIVIKGHKHLHECAYIGDNSSEEIEEVEERMKELGITDSPANKPDQMKRHRPGVHFRDPLKNNATNDTMGNIISEEAETDSKIMKVLLGQLNEKTKERKKQKLIDSINPIEFTKEGVLRHRNQTINEEEKKHIVIGTDTQLDSEEVFRDTLKKLQRLGDRGQTVLQLLVNQFANDSVQYPGNVPIQVYMKNVRNYIIDQNQTVLKTHGRQWTKDRIHYEDDIDASRRRKRETENKTAELNEDDERGNKAIEETFEPDGIADDRGTFNETDPNDMSNSEFWSSFSSSEEALLNCAGLILNLPLTPHRHCEKQRGDDSFEEASFANTVTYKVPTNGYYFFVFNSENEVQVNYVQVKFHLLKKMYNVSNPVAQCTNTTNDCAVNLSFFSDQKLVMELPVRNNDTLWNEEFVVLSECEPRTALYMISVISVPLIIILFAFQ